MPAHFRSDVETHQHRRSSRTERCRSNPHSVLNETSIATRSAQRSRPDRYGRKSTRREPNDPHSYYRPLVELLFQVLTEREEKNAIAIAFNQSFSAWTDTFTDPRLCAAIVDRLTYNATIIETGTNSYRLAHTRARHRTPATGA